MAERLEPAHHPMGQADREQLERHEATIRAGIETVMDVAAALDAIHEAKLYMAAGFVTFDVYCKQRWDFGAAYARRLMAARRTVELLPPEPETQALSEKQVRPLTTLGDDKEAVRKAWKTAKKAAHADGRAVPTAAEVSLAVVETTSKPAPLPASTPESAPRGALTGTVDFEAATISALVPLGRRRLLAVQKKINEALRVAK